MPGIRPGEQGTLRCPKSCLKHGRSLITNEKRDTMPYEDEKIHHITVRVMQPTCPVCGQPPDKPYRRYLYGKIVDGCIHRYHDAFLDKTTDEWRWVVACREAEKTKLLRQFHEIGTVRYPSDYWTIDRAREDLASKLNVGIESLGGYLNRGYYIFSLSKRTYELLGIPAPPSLL